MVLPRKLDIPSVPAFDAAELLTPSSLRTPRAPPSGQHHDDASELLTPSSLRTPRAPLLGQHNHHYHKHQHKKASDKARTEEELKRGRGEEWENYNKLPKHVSSAAEHARALKRVLLCGEQAVGLASSPSAFKRVRKFLDVVQIDEKTLLGMPVLVPSACIGHYSGAHDMLERASRQDREPCSLQWSDSNQKVKVAVEGEGSGKAGGVEEGHGHYWRYMQSGEHTEFGDGKEAGGSEGTEQDGVHGVLQNSHDCADQLKEAAASFIDDLLVLSEEIPNNQTGHTYVYTQIRPFLAHTGAHIKHKISLTILNTTTQQCTNAPKSLLQTVPSLCVDIRVEPECLLNLEGISKAVLRLATPSSLQEWLWACLRCVSDHLCSVERVMEELALLEESYRHGVVIKSALEAGNEMDVRVSFDCFLDDCCVGPRLILGVPLGYPAQVATLALEGLKEGLESSSLFRHYISMGTLKASSDTVHQASEQTLPNDAVSKRGEEMETKEEEGKSGADTASLFELVCIWSDACVQSVHA